MNFAKRSSAEWSPFPPSAVGALPIAAGDADWLVTVGLPRSAPPFLSFGGKPQISIPTVTELWGVSGGDHYRVIGSTGSGSPSQSIPLHPARSFT